MARERRRRWLLPMEGGRRLAAPRVRGIDQRDAPRSYCARRRRRFTHIAEAAKH